MDIANLPALLTFQLFLLFCRLGGAIMSFPGLSDLAVNMRTRLLMAVTASVVMFPVLSGSLPDFPDTTSVFIRMILVEVVIGIMMTIGARIFMGALQLAGEIVGFTAGLQTANLFDPSSGSNTSAPGVFLAITATVLIFVTNLHHIVFQSVFESYEYFPVGQMPDLGDTAKSIVKVVADMFMLGTKIAAPIMTMGFLVYTAFGIFNRLIPQMQVFFVAMPINITVGLLVLGISVSLMLTMFMEELFEHTVIFAMEQE